MKFSQLLIFSIIVFVNFTLNPLFTYGTSTVLEICDNKLDDNKDDIVDEPLVLFKTLSINLPKLLLLIPYFYTCKSEIKIA